LQSAQFDRNEALEIKKQLQDELDMNRFDKKKFQEQIDKDGKTILDLQRQCREMERILLRKHPDSVSALIGKLHFLFQFLFFVLNLFIIFVIILLFICFTCSCIENIEKFK